jgi:hypothetical protein
LIYQISLIKHSSFAHHRMNYNESTPQPTPGSPMPIEIPPVAPPPAESPQPEIDDPQPLEPMIPVREPGIYTPAQA